MKSQLARSLLAFAAGAALAARGAGALRRGRDRGLLARHAADNERRVDSIIASAMDAIITCDEAQRIVLFNAAAEKIFRCRADEAIGVPLDLFIPQR
jgi:PAS domain-containing protein